MYQYEPEKTSTRVNEPCPACGMRQINGTDSWICGSIVLRTGDIYQSESCAKIQDLKAENERIQGALEAATDNYEFEARRNKKLMDAVDKIADKVIAQVEKPMREVRGSA